MGDADFDQLWETLIVTGVLEQMKSGETLTPQAYVPKPSVAAADELTLPPPVGLDGHEALAHLPRLELSDEDKAELRRGPVLGSGGMGEVVLARQQSLQRDVAVKRLHTVDEARVQTLLREARITGALEHPGIVPIHALGVDDNGAPILVMKRVEGQRWSEQIAGPGDPSALTTATLDRHLEILADVCNALHYAHSKGVIHRDVKPENVMVGEFGEVVLVDWGIACRMNEPDSGLTLGTPTYMAPEMVAGKAPTARTDVYLLGATLHRILTGRSRHRGKSVETILRAAWESDPYRYSEEVPAELGDIANKACARKPRDRYASALAFRDAIAQWQVHRTSAMLTQAARTRWATVVERLDDPSEDVEELQDLANSVRFGLQSALDQWPRNVRAVSLYREVLEALVRFAIRRRRFRYLETVWAEFQSRTDVVPAGLADEVEQMRRRGAALDKLGAGLDLSVGGRFRLWFMVLFTLAAWLNGGLLLVGLQLGFWSLTHTTGLVVAVGASALLSGALLIGRSFVLNTLANQRVMYSVFVAAWGVVANRVICAILGVDMQVVVVIDQLLLALAAAMAGVGVNLRVLLLAAVMLFGAVASALVPHMGIVILTVCIGLAGPMLIALFWPWMRG